MKRGTLLIGRALEIRVSGRRLFGPLDFELKAGECWGVLGRNGAGKTTLIHTFAGLRAPAQGEIRVMGRPLAGYRRRHLARLLGLVPQDDSEGFPTTVLDAVLAGRYPFLGFWNREQGGDLSRARNALRAMGLLGLASRSTSTLSGGERRRLALATLLTQDPPIALLDEPLGHLDLGHQKLVLETLRQRCTRGSTVLMSLHDPALARRYCSHLLLLLGDGEVIAGGAEDAGRLELLEKAYGHPLIEVPSPTGPLFAPR